MRQALQSLTQPFFQTLTQKEQTLLHNVDSFLEEHPISPIVGSKQVDDSLSIATLVARMNRQATSLAAALLYPLLQRNMVTSDELQERFGKEVGFLCLSLEKLPTFSFPALEVQEDSVKNETLIREQAECFRKMLIALARDMRVVMLRFCERLHRLNHLAFLPVEEQRIVAYECRQIYAPLANRLGISWLKNEMEDLSLRYIYPYAFYGIVDQLDSKQKERQDYIQSVQNTLETLVREADIPSIVSGRSKHINSIYRKMQKRKLSFDQLYDVTAFRLICETKDQCYQLLGMIHDRWKPIPGRFKDYIAIPKRNMYQSLHTTVLGPKNKRLEVQIRTHEMHSLAEDGIAAHWLYKESGPVKTDTVDSFRWLRNLLSLNNEKDDDKEFMASVRDHLREGEVFVFTPKGHVKELPIGATPIDFAYAIHTDVGHRCTGAKVNGKMVPLRYELKNGDLIDIITSSTSEPKQAWLQFAKTNRARTKIRSRLRIEYRKEAYDQGKEALEKALPSGNRSLSKLTKNGSLPRAAEQFSCANVDELYQRIGYNEVIATDVVAWMFPPETKEQPPHEEPIPITQKLRPKNTRNGIQVDGMDDILVQMAGCCNPIPGDEIVGFISRGRGVIVHTRQCIKVQQSDQQRIVDVNWIDNAKFNHTVILRIFSENRPGILNLQSRVFSDLNINISAANCSTDRDEATNVFRCQVKNTDQLQKLIRQLEELKGVISVERIRQ